ncbi:hypothetical protein F53441_4661 [Fusarium austroafricanum]|uniref:catalase n=1 Tax=Fusarium austroafricanum TaxID=2364996 RepID=A0A8H4NVB9_9HYPO|nr:hypothetical protein F53441_4661 [Fusarium austroafricanum]
MSSDVGGPFEEQESLKAGERGLTLQEGFIFRQKITHFDHERVPERAVHARGAGAHGMFISNGNYSNITAASFLGSEGKKTPTFVRFSTVAGSRVSADTARDVHGFATRFYTEGGSMDLVGNSIPVFFIQDAIQFPDLIHAVKPSPDKEPADHTSAYFILGNGRIGYPQKLSTHVTDDGNARFVKWHWKSKQGKASLIWDEAQRLSGKNPDYHRADLWDAIESGNGPEWELNAQIFDED